MCDRRPGPSLVIPRGNQEGEDSRQYITRSKEGTTASESSAGGADVRRQGGASTSGAATASPKWLPPELQVRHTATAGLRAAFLCLAGGSACSV